MKRAESMQRFHCPSCGEFLVEVERKTPEDCDDACWNCDKFDKCDIKDDESIWYKCENCNRFGDDFPIICHQPFGSTKSAPGDSWSLSWVK